MKSFYELDNTLESSSIGQMVARLRRNLGFSQDEFAKGTKIARSSLAKLENTQSNDEIGKELLYRIFYVASRLEENTSKTYIIELTKKIKDEIIETIEED